MSVWCVGFVTFVVLSIIDKLISDNETIHLRLKLQDTHWQAKNSEQCVCQIIRSIGSVVSACIWIGICVFAKCLKHIYNLLENLIDHKKSSGISSSTGGAVGVGCVTLGNSTSAPLTCGMVATSVPAPVPTATAAARRGRITRM
jgi:hypothetical protein